MVATVVDAVTTTTSNNIISRRRIHNALSTTAMSSQQQRVVVMPIWNTAQWKTTGKNSAAPTITPTGRRDDEKEMCVSTKSFVAGYLAGVSGLLVGYPLDSIKVMLQNKAGSSSSSGDILPRQSSSGPVGGSSMTTPRGSSLESSSTTTSSTFQQRRTLLTSEGAASRALLSSSPSNRTIRQLYSGIGAPLLTVGVVQSISFCLYESMRSMLRSGRRSGQGDDFAPDRIIRNDPLSDVTIASAVAGGAVSVITSPLVLLKTKQQLMVWSMQEALQDTWKMSKNERSRTTSRMKNFYTGYPLHFLCESVGRAVFFTSYEHMKRTIGSYRDANATTPQGAGGGGGSITVVDRMISACVSGMLSYAVIYPLDVLRTKTYAHSALFPGHQGATPSPYAIARDLWTREGIRPFFRGCTVACIRSGPVAAVALPIYDLTLAAMDDGDKLGC